MAPKEAFADRLSRFSKSILEWAVGTRKNTPENYQVDFFNLVIDSLPHPFYVIDIEDYTVELANSAATQQGLTDKTTCYALSHRRDRPCDSEDHPCPIEIIKRTKQPVTVEHIHFDRNGNPRNVEVHAYPILDNEGNVSRVIEYSIDITERKNMEMALRDSEMRFRSVAQSAKDAIISADKKGIIVFWNQAAKQMFGYDKAEVIGRPLKILMPEGFRKAHQEGLEKHQHNSESLVIGQTIEVKGLTKAGIEFPIELSVSSWKAGEDFFYTGIIRDISDRKHIERERDQLIQSLQESLAKVKTLSGLLPICASCKKIRDDRGYWNQIETYIQEHSEAAFSHGICPQCINKLYPGLSKKGSQ